MPDWSYQTVFRPLLFRLPAQWSRDLTLALMGGLSRLPLGGAVIDFLGHMRPDERLAVTFRNVRFASPIGLGPGIDPDLIAAGAFARFGFGFFEIGPVSYEAVKAAQPIERLPATQEIILHCPDENPGLETVVHRLSSGQTAGIPTIVRVAQSAASSLTALQKIVKQLSAITPLFSLPITALNSQGNGLGSDDIQHVRDAGAESILLVVPPVITQECLETVDGLVASKVVDGLIIDGAFNDDCTRRTIGISAFAPMLHAVEVWRQRLEEKVWIIASGGIHEPRQALEVITAGADMVGLDSGFIFSGPGLPKRINDTLLYAGQNGLADRPDREPAKAAHQSWFWALLMGLSMLIGGVLAMAIAVDRVVLPYDESIVGLTRQQIAAINDRLLDFMAHDRVTLSGTMLSVGLLYFVLSVFGVRRGAHWAHHAIVYSAWCGFISFFLFLGFGYFDPFHAFVTAVLFQFLLLMIHSPLPPHVEVIGPNVRNDWRWQASQWGQFLYVIHGAVLVVAGLVISKIGITSVFVAEDLEFMQTSAKQLFQAHPRLVPLIAHDRATFGGMLIACGVAVLLSALWGYRRGQTWLWWGLILGGNIAYVATALVHMHVGYTSHKHLIPVYGGLALLWLGALFSYPYLCQRDDYHEQYWQVQRKVTGRGRSNVNLLP